MDELKDSVARDLEALLNSRAAMQADCFEAYPEAHRSVASFGMADFVGFSLANPADRDRICRTLERSRPFAWSSRISTRTRNITRGWRR